MFVAVVRVWVVLVGVGHRLVRVGVPVSDAGRDMLAGSMVVVVVTVVVRVPVPVRDGLVRVRVLVLLGQVEPGAESH